MIRIITALFLILTLGGCAAAAVGGYAYVSADKREQRQEFLADFQANNLEREKQGLEPLEFCTELRRFDNDMWEDDPECQGR